MFFGLILKKPGRQAPFVCMFSLDCANLECSISFFFFFMMPVSLSIVSFQILIAAVAHVFVEACE